MKISISKFCLENNLNETEFRLKLVEHDSKCDSSKTVEDGLAYSVLESFKNNTLVLGSVNDVTASTNPTEKTTIESELLQNSIETLKTADFITKTTNDRLLENYKNRNLELIEKIREIRIARLDALEQAFSDLDTVKVEKTNLTSVQKSKFDFFI